MGLGASKEAATHFTHDGEQKSHMENCVCKLL